MEIHEQHCEPWKVTLIDTGLNTQTGGRVLRSKKYLGNEPFMLIYGDDISNFDIKKLIEFHHRHGKLATMTSVQPEVFDYIKEGDATIFERRALETLANNGELYSYRNDGFWKCMDTLRDKQQLQAMWDASTTPWKSWSE